MPFSLLFLCQLATYIFVAMLSEFGVCGLIFMLIFLVWFLANYELWFKFCIESFIFESHINCSFSTEKPVLILRNDVLVISFKLVVNYDLMHFRARH